jgi:uncharacterized repeat protein (TIGR03803 family)
MTTGGAFSISYSFSAAPRNANADGSGPMCLIVGADGAMYGTAPGAGENSYGTVFKYTMDGKLTTLYSFDESDGAYPNTLMQAANGILYGTTSMGGAHDNGVLFKITTAGSFTLLRSFNRYFDVANPGAPLVQATDGNLYGTTTEGGANDMGAIYKLTTAGAFSLVYSFPTQYAGANTYGTTPSGALLQASDGNLYGAAAGGGANGAGVIYRLTLKGAVTCLYTFSALTTLYPETNKDGANPRCALIQSNDGCLYGTATAGGKNGWGTVFRLVPPVYVNAVSVAPAIRKGGQPATLTLALCQAVPTGSSVTVNLTSNGSAVVVPATAVVSGGQTGVSLPVTINGVLKQCIVTLTASAFNQPKPAGTTVTVNPVAVSSVVVSPSQAAPGAAVTGTVTLDSTLACACSVAVSAAGTGVSVPASVKLAAGTTSATFSVTTSAVTKPTLATITAAYAGSLQTASLFVIPPGSLDVKTVTASPTTVKVGKTVTLTVGLYQKVPTGASMTVNLNSNGSSIALPATAVVGSGQSSVAVSVAAGAVTKATTVTITAGVPGQVTPASATVTVTP